jgi:peptide/nickel transport system substrate-binding protein
MLDDVTWRFNLREGVTFHNGNEFTAEDVQYSIMRILNGSKEEFIVYDQWTFVSDVRVIDDYTVEMEMSAPTPYNKVLSSLSGTGCGIVDKDYVEEVGNDGLANAGVGTGPFKLEDYERDSFVQLSANENYWDGKPDIDELTFRVIPEPATRLAELLAGGVDLAPGVLPQDWERIEEDERLKMVHYLTDRVYGLTCACTPPEGVDGVATELPEIRQAISYAIDREALIELVGGFGEPTLTRLTPPIPCWEEVDPPLYGVNPYDPDRARELMEEAGYPDVPGGPVITLHGTFGQYIGQREIAETIAAMLRDVGFEVELDIREFSTFRETVYRGSNEELILQSLGNFITDPWLFVLNYDSNFGETTGTRDRCSFEDIDTLADQINTELDPEQRCEYVAEYAQTVVERMPTVELFQMADSIAMPENLEWTPPKDGMLQFVNASYTE